MESIHCKCEVKEDILNLLNNKYDYKNSNSYRIIAEGYIRRGPLIFIILIIIRLIKINI